MPSLRQILEDTMLFQAAHGKNQDPMDCQLRSCAPIVFPEPSPGSSSLPVDTRPIWHFQHSGRPGEITSLRAWPRAMGYAHPMTVCESISWEPPRILRAAGQQGITLPLDSAFLVQRFHLPDGFITGSHQLWPLPHQIDHSFAEVFVYEIKPDQSLAPVPESVWSAEGFMPNRSSGWLNAIIRIGERMTGEIRPLYVCVVISLTTCKEKNDFEPAGVLGAGRIFPHVMIMANQPLAQASAAVILRRPPMSSHTGPDMDPTIRSGLFTDTNQARSKQPIVGNVPPPYWPYIFDYYKLDGFAADEEYTMVDPNLKRRIITNGAQVLLLAQLIDPTVAFLDFEPLHEPASKNFPARVFEYYAINFPKLDYQGAFDSIHIAPSMRAYPSIYRDPSLGVAPWLDSLTSIKMAPFCEHDCLHTHWRWGASWDQTPSVLAPNKMSLMGFAGDRPYATIGAPLVPSNQTVKLRLISPSSFRYAADAGSIPAGGWQVIYHHGSAYSLFVNNQDTKIKVLKQLLAHSQEWALVYWNMRWQATQTGPLERILPNLAACVS